MKKYIKDGEIKLKKDIILYKNNIQIINPNETTLLNNGWKVFNISESDKISSSKLLKKHDIEIHNDSLKGFIIDGEEVNIDTETLNKITFRVTAESAMNKSKTSIWLNGKEYEFKTKDVLELLYNLQIYFGECFDISERHKLAIDSLTNVEEIESYNYSEGYPEKIEFQIR